MRFAMADDEGRVQRKGQGRDSRGMGRRSEAGFDRWLVDQLRKLYDEVLEEEVPEDLVKVVRAFDAGQAGETGADRERSQAQESPRSGRSRRPAADRSAPKPASAKKHSCR
jgi:hypothetical protein